MDISQGPLTPARDRRWTALLLMLAGGGAIFIAVISNRLFELGPFSHHMIVHIALMNAAAPAAALIWRLLIDRRRTRIGFGMLVVFGALQLFLFFAWHSPPMAAGVMKSVTVSSIMQISLFTAAFLFWLALFHQPRDASWRSIVSLLVTGKLFCLMAALLVFSPRVLYGARASALESAVTLADQQLAGLVMVIACPLAYVASAIFLTVRWLNGLADQSDASARRSALEARA